jgi:galactokinase
MGGTSVTDATAVTRLAERGFGDGYRRAPEVVWSAPGRANLIGEHTDYNDGFVLPFAIAERTAVAAASRDDGVVTVASTFAPGSVSVALAAIVPGGGYGWAGYPLGVAWALGQVRDLPEAAGADLFIHSDVPAGGGLSSSAALEMAAAGALAYLWGLSLDAAELARAGQRAENEVVGAPTGVMDQYASLLGQPDAAVFLDCRSLRARSVPLRLAAAGMTLVLTDTGERHAHAHGGYAARRASCEKGAALLGVPALRDLTVADLPKAEAVLDAETFRRVRHVVTEDARVEATVADLEAGDLPAVGRRLVASHASMRDDYEITTQALDLAVEVALSAGALGARMTGGGFGGSTITLIDADQAPALTTALRDAFATAGYGAPRVGTVIPGPGAWREVTSR